jgi:hypothetical protein
MLKDIDVTAVLPAKDVGRAKDFTGTSSDWEPAEPGDDNVMFQCGNGTRFMLYQTDNAGTAKNTQMGWVTDDVERDVQELRSRGVVFEEYDFPGLKTENGVATSDAGKAAWFLDSEGNILSLFERP